MSYYLRIIFSDHIADVPLAQTTVINDSLYNAAGLKGEWLFVRNSGGYHVSGAGHEQNLKEGEFFPFSPSVRGLLVWEEKQPVVSLDTTGIHSFVIGRDAACELCLPNRKTPSSDCVLASRKHARMEKHGMDWTVVPTKEDAKLYLNGQLVTARSILLPDDVLCLGKYTIRRAGSTFAVYAAPYALEKNGETEPGKDGIPQPPVFNRSPHIQTPIPCYEIQVPVKDTIGNKPEINWLTTLLPPFMMMIIMGSFAYFMGMTTMLMTIPMTCMSAVVSIMNYRSQKKKYAKRVAASEKEYQDALKLERKRIETIKKEQLHIMETEYPCPQECKTIVEQKDIRLWRIRPDEEAFMSLRLGLGDMPTRISLKSLANHEAAIDLQEEGSYVEQAPVSVSLRDYPVVGVVGEKAAIVNTLSGFILQTAVNHSYDEVKIIAYLPNRKTAELQWMRWLPHVWDEGRQRRYIAGDGETAKLLSEEFEEILEKRVSPVMKNANRSGAHYLFIVADLDMVKHHAIIKYLTSADSELNISVVFVAESRGNLPAGCKAIIENRGRQVCWYPTNDNSNPARYSPDTYSRELCSTVARTMAPIRLAENVANKTFPSSISFLEGYGVRTAEELQIEKKWKASRPGRSLAVPIGVKETGEKLLFDINRKHDGPHGMVAGATGSGKSDLVQSWILSMALHFKPTDVSFVIVDYKGDGLLAPFRRLPHLVGTISNLDRNVLRNVVALQSEIDRRTLLFSEKGVHNIEDYFEKREHGEIDQPLPYLIIVLDEFKDFRSTHPEFLPIVSTIYTKGASLGIYCMILAQDAADAAHGTTILTNSHFYWCMKVENPDASSGMLGTLDAYTMPKVPGRGFVKVGNFERYEKIQAYWSGASYQPSHEAKERKAPPVSEIGIDGTRKRVMDSEKSAGIWSSEKEIDRVIDYICTYVEENRIEVPAQLWSPPLPTTLSLEEICGWNQNADSEKLYYSIGLIDNPSSQKQFLMRFSPFEHGHILVSGSPESGKTTVLVSSILSMARNYSPEQLEFYFFDYDKNALNMFRNLPHCRGCSVGAEPEDVERMVTSVMEELKNRRQLFLNAGIVSFDVFCQRIRRIPILYLIVDNLNMAWEDGSSMQNMLYAIAQRGAGYGIYLLASSAGTSGSYYKIADFFKTKFSLYQNDKSNYTGIVGRTEILPEELPGRGLIRIGRPVEFQTAITCAGESEMVRENSILDEVLAMKQEWDSYTQSSGQPKSKSWQDYYQRGELFLCTDAGINTEYFLSASGKHTLLIAVHEEEDRKNLLKALTEQLQGMEGTHIYYDDSKGMVHTVLDGMHLPSESYCCYEIGNKDGDDYLFRLMAILSDRQEKKDRNPEISFPQITILIAELGQYFEAADDQSIVYLKDVVTLAGELGVILLVLGRDSSIRYLGSKGEKFTSSLLRQKHTMVLGGSIEELHVLSTTLSLQEQSVVKPVHKGWYQLDSVMKQIEIPEHEQKGI